jgi:hypothetical protein
LSPAHEGIDVMTRLDVSPRRTDRPRATLAIAAGAMLAAAIGAWAQENLGFTDTPLLPGDRWHVHDGARPQPKVVDPGTASSQSSPGRPPSDAVVLFDGTDLSNWRDSEGKPSRWKLEGGALVSTGGAGQIISVKEFGDCQLHVEFATPTDVKGNSQGRGNSGVFLFNRYEVQVLDSYQNPTYPDGQAAAIYGQHPPLVNASRKPGEWQTYDILFTAPRFKGEELVSPAYATVFHNGVAVHNHVRILGAMAYRQFPKYVPHAARGPISFQDHGNPVRFRNIWVRELKDYDQP